MSTQFDCAASYGITGFYEVGGHVRDQFMGLESNDIDYAVEAKDFASMEAWVRATHADVFQVKPEFATVRALFTKGDVRDYVLCRRDGAYTDARRPDQVLPGTIYDDLARRDFTVNAIAKNVMTGEILDPHGGVNDIKTGLLRCVGDTFTRFNEDTLRIVRAVRFMTTKGLSPSEDMFDVLRGRDGLLSHWVARLDALPTHRRFEELEKMFKTHSLETMRVINWKLHYRLQTSLMAGIWLQPRTKGLNS